MKILFLGGDLVMGTYWPNSNQPRSPKNNTFVDIHHDNRLLLDGISANVERPVDLAKWLIDQNEDVVYTEMKISKKFCENSMCDLIICYNYKYLLPEHIIKVFSGHCINLHISYLPWNRGYHPYIWNILEFTPSGVTIHKIDEGIDTGDIIVQKKVAIDEDKETIKGGYEILHEEIQQLFKDNWLKIVNNQLTPKKQAGGNHHYRYEFTKFEPFLRKKGWKTNISDFKDQYLRSKI